MVRQIEPQMIANSTIPQMSINLPFHRGHIANWHWKKDKNEEHCIENLLSWYIQATVIFAFFTVLNEAALWGIMML